MPIRVECGGCRAVLNVKDALAGKNANCPKCGAPIQIPGAGGGAAESGAAVSPPTTATPPVVPVSAPEARPAPANPPKAPSSRSVSAVGARLTDVSLPDMVEEISRRKKSAVLVVFETPQDGSYALGSQPGAKVNCYRTGDMNDEQLMQVLGELGKMSTGQAGAKGGMGLDGHDVPVAFELKGDHVGTTLAEFKTKYARQLGAGLKAPFCSDSFPGQANDQLRSEPWHHAAGIIHARIDLPSENHSPTIAGVDTELLLYQFVDEQLFRITALFNTESYHHIREALTQKHGPPAEELHDPDGYVWMNAISKIELVRGSIRPPRPSMLHFVHMELYMKFQSRMPTRTQDL